MEDQQYDPVTGRPDLIGDPNAGIDLTGKTQVFGLDYKTAAILAYLPICAVNLITSLVIINSEPKGNRFLRFHAMQSLVMMVVYMVAAIANWTVTLFFGAIPIIGGIVAGLINLVFFALSIVFIWQCVLGMISASKGQMRHIPYIGQIAEERLAQ